MNGAHCVVTDCRHRDGIHGCKVIDTEYCWQRFGCVWGEFVSEITMRFGYLGEWSFRRVGSYSDILVATLNGTRGKVEVWGGARHRNEIWAFPKGSAGILISTNVVTTETVEAACGRAGLQQKLEI